MLHARTWGIATRVIKQNLERVDTFVRLFTRGKPTLSPTRISFMRFLASGFRTPSHGVVPTASKSSTLNLDKLKQSPRVFWDGTHLNIFSLYYTGMGLCLHEPVLGLSVGGGHDRLVGQVEKA